MRASLKALANLNFKNGLDFLKSGKSLYLPGSQPNYPQREVKLRQPMPLQMQKRTRGYVLTPEGAKKLEAAKREWETQHEARCTEEKMNELTSPYKERGLYVGTIRKIFKGEKTVDKKSIHCLFSAFNLQLDDDDLTSEPQACLPKLDPNFLGRDEAIANLNAPVSQADESDLDALVEKVRSHPHHRDKIQAQCGSLRILDVEWLVGIDNIYIDVNVLGKLPSNRHLELSDFHRFNPATDDFDRLGLGNVREEQVPGLVAVARYSKLMVLGKPGSGKTTFLKFLAIQCIQGDFQKERIPIFIELKVFARDAKRKGEFSLLNYINQELSLCDISPQQVETLLHQGRFLILLDGLDEVQSDAGEEILAEVYDFSRKYFRNQVVITCRIAAQLAIHRGSLEFTDVEVADFTPEQIEAFAQKWFVAVARNSKEKGLIKADQFIKKLYFSETQQIRELAGTPILLNLTCLVFLEKADLPSKRYKLYEQGLDIMLERWDESRNIKRDEAYQKLTLEDKKELLRQLAFITFERGDYFFEQDQIQQLIANYLVTLPDIRTEPKALKRDSKIVLKSIEFQHGLLIERARGIYSFSHLTFQEYFTAKTIIDRSTSEAWKNLVSYIAEPHWREVFLLLIEMLSSADFLLQLMKQQVNALVADDEELQQFLMWVRKKSLSIQAPYKPVAIRAYYFESLIRTDPDLDYLENGYLPFIIDEQLEEDLRYDKSFGFDLDLDDSLIEALDNVMNELPLAYIQYNLILEPKFQYALKNLVDQLPDSNSGEEIFDQWCKAYAQTWIENLRHLMITYRNIGHDWHFSNEQRKVLMKYHEANKLLIACLNSASDKVTPILWREIEENLFLPKDEIEQQEAEVNSRFRI